MNIIINKNKITDYKDKSLTIENNHIIFKTDGEYNITIDNSTNIKLNINLENNISIKIFIKSVNNDININTHYILNKNSKIALSKFYYNKNNKEEEIIDLNGENSIFKSNFSSISTNEEEYHTIINHNNKSTKSYISNKCIGCDNSKINFTIDSILEKGNSNCIMDQNTKILTLGDVDAQIETNMFIDEDTVEARHGSVIGTFSYDDVFYLMSRGIKEQEAIDLLLKGFIFSNLELNMESTAFVYNCIKNIRR